MPAARYRYELRKGDQVVATGHLTLGRVLEPGDTVEIAGQAGLVRTVEPLLGQDELRLVVELAREASG